MTLPVEAVPGLDPLVGAGLILVALSMVCGGLLWFYTRVMSNRPVAPSLTVLVGSVVVVVVGVVLEANPQNLPDTLTQDSYRARSIPTVGAIESHYGVEVAMYSTSKEGTVFSEYVVLVERDRVVCDLVERGPATPAGQPAVLLCGGVELGAPRHTSGS